MGALTTGDIATIRADLARVIFDTPVIVYGADPTTHNYTVVLKSDLRCFLRHLTSDSDAGARDELSGRREMWFPGDYTLPDYCELLIDGTRWAPLEGTQTLMLGGAYRRIDIREQRA